MRRAAALAPVLTICALAAGCGGDPPVGSEGPAAPSAPQPVTAPDPAERGAPVVRGPIELIDGTVLPAARLRGRVVLVVNTASRCGFAPQFADLEALSASRGARGLTVVGFPSDDFAQELDDPDAIAEFCELNYGVRFPMAAPGRVTGPSAQPVFRAIAERGGGAGVAPDWNFTKYVIDREGRLVARFAPAVTPDDPRLTGVVDRLLAEPADA